MEGLWNRASTQIRTVDNNTLIWFEGSTYDILSGFNNVPLGDGSKTVQSFHYYNPPQVGSIESTIKNRITDNKRLKTASVLTEFTMWMGDSTQMSNMQSAVDTSDKYMTSWMGWAYENLYNSDGTPHPEIQAHYSRAYPSAIAGTPQSFGYNTADSSFSLVFAVKTSIDAPTEIVLPTITYPNGYNVSITPAESIVHVVKDTRTLALFANSAATDGQTITVSITKK
jgi:endoglycosylceramidase